jgi:steroid 5-alpha reductase family enzyme
LVVVIFFTLIWGISVYLKDASIVDIFWGAGFILVSAFYFLITEAFYARKIIMLAMVLIWGLRLSVHIMWRNMGKEEDFRYREFRKRYGEHRYWWVSYFQVFLLQGFILWLVSAPLLAVQYFTRDGNISILDYISVGIWLTGFLWESVADWQLLRFKSKAENEGIILKTGLWKYSRHPNYFGDALVWWGFGLLGVASGSYISLLSPVLMTYILIKVSGVSLLEKSLMRTKPGYLEYKKTTNAFIPWIPKK